MTRWRAKLLERPTEIGYLPKPAVLATVGDQQLIADGTEIVSPSWRHECGAKPNAIHVSADRVLATTDSLEYDNAWGILGPALLLDLDTGTRIAELRGDRGAALDGGRFLLGLEGYGIFETWLHDRAGTRTTTWHSYGHYVVDVNGVRVVECDRSTPTRSAVVRLLPDGGIERGHQLRDGLAPAPVVLPDGTIVMVDGGRLLAVSPDLRGRELATVPGWEAGYGADLDWQATDGTLTITTVPWSGPLHRIRFSLTARSAAPWSRREG